MGVSDKTARSYLDILTGTYMIRQLQPWYENIGKRQIKSPKIYLRDTGLLHSLIGLPDMHGLAGHPKVGASWEGFVIEQVQRILQPVDLYFWATHSGAEIDLFFVYHGRRLGIEIKYSEAPKISASMHTALETLQLDHLWLIYPGRHSYPVSDRITVYSILDLSQLIEARVS